METPRPQVEDRREDEGHRGGPDQRGGPGRGARQPHVRPKQRGRQWKFREGGGGFDGKQGFRTRFSMKLHAQRQVPSDTSVQW